MRAPHPDRSDRRDVAPAAPRPRAVRRPGYRVEDGKLLLPGNPVADWAKKDPPSAEPLLAYVTGGRMRRSVIDALLSMGKPLVVTVEIDPKTERVATWSVRTSKYDGKADPKVGPGGSGG